METFLGVRVPKPNTRKKYGLSLDHWEAIISAQCGVCPICEKLPKSRMLVIDHFHVRGWKDMPPEERASYVRGALCNYCNFRVLRKGMTVQRLRNALDYLERFEKGQSSTTISM